MGRDVQFYLPKGDTKRVQQLSDLVPFEKRSVVEKALQSAFGTRVTEEASPLTGGMSSSLLYRVRVAGQEYVLRLVMARDALRDPARHFQCLELAAQAGIAPPVLYTNAGDGISITRFIQHTELPPAPAVLMFLAYIIRQIHALPSFPPLIDFLDGVDGLIAQFKASPLLPEELTEEHFRYYTQIQHFYPRNLDQVSSHNDLNPSNLLYDGQKLWVVDWEAAFRNDRYVDLAIAATYFVNDEAQVEHILTTYFGVALNDTIRDRFFLMRRVCEMYYAMVFLSFLASSRPPEMAIDLSMETPTLAEWQVKVGTGEISRSTSEGQILAGKVFLNECLRHMKTPRFDRVILGMGSGQIGFKN